MAGDEEAWVCDSTASLVCEQVAVALDGACELAGRGPHPQRACRQGRWNPPGT